MAQGRTRRTVQLVRQEFFSIVCECLVRLGDSVHRLASTVESAQNIPPRYPGDTSTQISCPFASIPRVCSPHEAAFSSHRGLLLPSFASFHMLHVHPPQSPKPPLPQESPSPTSAPVGNLRWPRRHLVLCWVGPKARKPRLRALSSPARLEPDCGLGRAQGSGLRFGRPKPNPRARAFGA